MNDKPVDDKQLMLVKDGRMFPAHRVEATCACCQQDTLVRYRSHYGWTVTCTDGCGEIVHDEERTVH